MTDLNYTNILDSLKEKQHNKSEIVQNLLEKACDNINLAIFEDSKKEVRYNIRNVILDIVHDSKCNSLTELENEVDLTSLVEEICDSWNVNFEGGPLDNNDHWIWEEVPNIIQKIGEELENENNSD